MLISILVLVTSSILFRLDVCAVILIPVYPYSNESSIIRRNINFGGYQFCNKRKDILSIGPEDTLSDVKIGIVKVFQQPMLIYANRLSRIQI